MDVLLYTYLRGFFGKLDSACKALNMILNIVFNSLLVLINLREWDSCDIGYITPWAWGS